ncbi:hypothetical protein [Sphingopyxis sp.]|uniref:hypothetical protein n=1 Tax=Sphingopyxis sp. TaxID=1908224 RepID=UPI0026315918|nr:hypothetical protein [Sphingopyxis sp.]MCW0198311.1 hypothetical protein [Sphingopyxis sp.]
MRLPARPSLRSRAADLLGVGLSLACLIHCLALPLLLLAAHEGWIAGLDPETGDRLLTSLGALGLASAHIANWRLRHGKAPSGI